MSYLIKNVKIYSHFFIIAKKNSYFWIFPPALKTLSRKNFAVTRTNFSRNREVKLQLKLIKDTLLGTYLLPTHLYFPIIFLLEGKKETDSEKNRMSMRIRTCCQHDLRILSVNFMVNFLFVFYEYIVYRFIHGRNEIISWTNDTKFCTIDRQSYSWIHYQNFLKIYR